MSTPASSQVTSTSSVVLKDFHRGSTTVRRTRWPLSSSLGRATESYSHRLWDTWGNSTHRCGEAIVRNSKQRQKKMKTSGFVRSVLVILMTSIALCLAAQERFALVIGNGAYTSVSKLKNPVNDATDIAAALEQLGFKVTLLTNASRREMNQGLNDFHDKLAQDSANAGFFWYAGHGVQSKGENYLIPITRHTTGSRPGR